MNKDYQLWAFRYAGIICVTPGRNQAEAKMQAEKNWMTGVTLEPELSVPIEQARILLKSKRPITEVVRVVTTVPQPLE